MNLLVWLAVGGLIGWLASLWLHSDPEQGVFMNVVVGIVGALAGGWIVGPLVGARATDAHAFSASALLVSLVGAVVLLAVVTFVRRRRRLQ
jgi:uncharacterized membrane protein YeaQ/YmgE (transglycosylase-associated protein family)